MQTSTSKQWQTPLSHLTLLVASACSCALCTVRTRGSNNGCRKMERGQTVGKNGTEEMTSAVTQCPAVTACNLSSDVRALSLSHILLGVYHAWLHCETSRFHFLYTIIQHAFGCAERSSEQGLLVPCI